MRPTHSVTRRWLYSLTLGTKAPAPAGRAFADNRVKSTRIDMMIPVPGLGGMLRNWGTTSGPETSGMARSTMAACGRRLWKLARTFLAAGRRSRDDDPGPAIAAREAGRDAFGCWIMIGRQDRCPWHGCLQSPCLFLHGEGAIPF